MIQNMSNDKAYYSNDMLKCAQKVFRERMGDVRQAQDAQKEIEEGGHAYINLMAQISINVIVRALFTTIGIAWLIESTGPCVRTICSAVDGMVPAVWGIVSVVKIIFWKVF